ncbi:hypothetical protein BVRB_022530, partial [Beta vulgaris subsp. vulgaris]
RDLKGSSALFQRGESETTFDLGDLQRCGVSIGLMLRLDAILGVLSIKSAQLSVDNLGRDELTVFMASLCNEWTALSTKEASVKFLDEILVQHSWRLRHALLYRTPEPLDILDEVVFVNWMVSELERVTVMTSTTALVLLACHVIFSQRPRDDQYPDLNQVSDEVRIILRRRPRPLAEAAPKSN